MKFGFQISDCLKNEFIKRDMYFLSIYLYIDKNIRCNTRFDRLLHVIFQVMVRKKRQYTKEISFIDDFLVHL
jgi:hypothetical protein